MTSPQIDARGPHPLVAVLIRLQARASAPGHVIGLYARDYRFANGVLTKIPDPARAAADVAAWRERQAARGAAVRREQEARRQPAPDVRDTAARMSMAARRRRLETLGLDPAAPCVAFDDLPDEDQAAWISAAHAAIEVLL